MTKLETAVNELAKLFNEDSMDVFEGFTCTEIDALVTVFNVAGHKEAAANVIAHHSPGDDAGDGHYVGDDTQDLLLDLLMMVPERANPIIADGLTDWWVLVERDADFPVEVQVVTTIEGETTIADAPKIIEIARPGFKPLVAAKQADHGSVHWF